MSAYGGSSLKYTSWAIFANVLTLNIPVLLMTIKIIMTSVFMVPRVSRACLSGSYMVYMWSVTACMFPCVEYLHSMSCSCLLPLNVGSMVRCSSESVVYLNVLTRFGL